MEKEKARKHRLMEAKRKSKDDIAMLIVAAILFIIASILLFLSFRYNTKKERVFTPTSLSFFISMILYGFTVFLSIFGGIRLFLHKKAIRESK